MSGPRFFAQPFQYLRWAAHEKPAIFYSFIIGGIGPASIFFAPPLRRLFNDDFTRERVPLTYPIPPGPRKIPQGYDDPS